MLVISCIVQEPFLVNKTVSLIILLNRAIVYLGETLSVNEEEEASVQSSVLVDDGLVVDCDVAIIVDIGYSSDYCEVREECAVVNSDF